jgi:hypothetical protein
MQQSSAYRWPPSVGDHVLLVRTNELGKVIAISEDPDGPRYVVDVFTPMGHRDPSDPVTAERRSYTVAELLPPPEP